VWGVLADGAPSGTRSHEAFARKALRYANIAVEKDGGSSAAHAALGLAFLEVKAPVAQAMSEFRRAIDLDPSNAEAHEWYAIRLLYGGNVREAKTHFEIAAELQPANVAVAWWRALVRYYLHDADDAVADFHTALTLNPSYALAQVGLVTALVERGRYHEAQEALRERHGANGSEVQALRALAAIVDLKLGLRRAAAAELQRLHAQDVARTMGDGDELVVAAFALGGRRDDALRLLARMHLERDAAQRRMIELDPLVGPVIRDLAYAAGRQPY
jgi:tetratricopeptide (TPR) repeat protein